MRIVGHVDMDAFYAAIEERDTPRLRGQPVVVGADPRGGEGRGVVSTANYPARVYGIHSAMPIATAWRCAERALRQGRPPVVFLPVDMPKYRQVSERIMAILHEHTPIVEPASIDEAYLDLSRTGTFERAASVCRALKERIRRDEHLTASIGIGPNKLVAKIASGLHKPDGLTIITEAEADGALAALPLRVIPGIGPKTEAELREQGFQRVGDLRRLSKEALCDWYGKRGLALYEKIRGRDDEPVSPVSKLKSIGEQETLFQDSDDAGMLTDRLMALCHGVMHRLADEGNVGFRTVVITVRFADFHTVSRRRTLERPTCELRTLQGEALRLFLPFLDRRENPQGKPIRLLGVRVEHFAHENGPGASDASSGQATLWPAAGA